MKDNVRDDMENTKTKEASCPETVKDLIELLKTFPPDRKLSFSPFNLHSVVDSGDELKFEIRELEGVHYNMVENVEG